MSANDALPFRLFLVSDVHVDAPENQRWVENLSHTSYQKDALILAGDVSEELDLVERTLRTLASKFAQVFFVPGNHDLWVSGEEDDECSMHKLHVLLALCDRLGVATRPQRFGHALCGIWVCPLLSFHHQSFDTEPDVHGWEIPTAEAAMCERLAAPDCYAILSVSPFRFLSPRQRTIKCACGLLR